MSKYTELVEEFYSRYDKPFVDKLTIGFSDIDPAEIDHEALNNLLAPKTNEHYHLTKAQYEKLIEIIDGDKYPPLIFPNQTINISAEGEMKPYEIQGKYIKLT